MTTAKTETVLITAQTERERLEQERDEIARAIAELKAELEQLREKIKAGTTSKTGEGTKTMAEVRYWLRAARDTEAEIDGIRRKDAGIVGEYGLDFDEAERAIGCRLARLRACCGAEGFSR